MQFLFMKKLFFAPQSEIRIIGLGSQLLLIKSFQHVISFVYKNRKRSPAKLQEKMNIQPWKDPGTFFLFSKFLISVTPWKNLKTLVKKKVCRPEQEFGPRDWPQNHAEGSCVTVVPAFTPSSFSGQRGRPELLVFLFRIRFFYYDFFSCLLSLSMYPILFMSSAELVADSQLDISTANS